MRYLGNVPKESSVFLTTKAGVKKKKKKGYD